MTRRKPVGLMRLNTESGGPLAVWEYPSTYFYDGDRKMINAYVIGADVSMGIDGKEGRRHGDFSCAHVINATTGMVCAVWHGLLPPDEFGEVLYELGWWYNCALLGVEANNHGLTTITRLRDDGYPRIFQRRTVQKSFNTQTASMGWYTSKVTKPLILDQLSRSIVLGELTIKDKGTISELLSFVRDTEDGSLHGSPHDDRVMSLAIANEMRKYAHAPEFQVNKRAPEYSLEWWANQLEEVPEEDPWQIGATHWQDE